jgi:hypothetical protein
MATQKGGDDPMEATMLFHMLDSQKKSDGKLELDEFIKGMALLGSDDATFKKEMEDVLAHLAAHARRASATSAQGTLVVRVWGYAKRHGRARP